MLIPTFFFLFAYDELLRCYLPHCITLAALEEISHSSAPPPPLQAAALFLDLFPLFLFVTSLARFKALGKRLVEAYVLSLVCATQTRKLRVWLSMYMWH